MQKKETVIAGFVGDVGTSYEGIEISFDGDMVFSRDFVRVFDKVYAACGLNMKAKPETYQCLRSMKLPPKS